jgi:hypothetical protein
VPTFAVVAPPRVWSGGDEIGKVEGEIEQISAKFLFARVTT